MESIPWREIAQLKFYLEFFLIQFFFQTQSVYRIYRIGQTKPCFIYRFVALGTMEEQTYKRQVNKLSMALRVVDAQKTDRHYEEKDLAQLYKFANIEAKIVAPPSAVPNDELLAVRN